MLAIFDSSVARRPDCFKEEHHPTPSENSVSTDRVRESLKRRFDSIYGDMKIHQIDTKVLFVYSLTPNLLHRPQFGDDDGGRFCLFKGRMEDMDSLKKTYELNERHNEAHIIIRASHMLCTKGPKTLKQVVQDLSQSGSFILYDKAKMLALVARASSGSIPLYWGIDPGSSLVISTAEYLVKQACRSSLLFPEGEVYISCQGRTGLEALFLQNGKTQIRPPMSMVQPSTMVTLEGSELLNPDPKKEAKVRCGELPYGPSPAATIERIVPYLVSRDSITSPEERWLPPISPHVVKINAAAIMQPNKKFLGVGVIVRDFEGKVLAAQSMTGKGIIAPFHAPLMALNEGARLALEHGYQRVIFETLNLNIQKLLPEERTSLLCHVAKKMSQLKCFSVNFICSSANGAAYGLAEFAKDVFEEKDGRVAPDKQKCYHWVHEVPECIADIVLAETPVKV